MPPLLDQRPYLSEEGLASAGWGSRSQSHLLPVPLPHPFLVLGIEPQEWSVPFFQGGVGDSSLGKNDFFFLVIFQGARIPLK